MFPIRLPVAAVACAIAAGCASVGPDYAPPDARALGVPDAWRGSEPAVAGPVAAAAWWRALGDPLLEALVRDALTQGWDAGIARARLREARARRAIAASGGYPTVSASASASRTRTGTGSGASRSLFDAGFDASWEPDLFGGQRRTVEGAEADVAAAIEDERGVQVSLAAEVALNYVEVRSLQARLAIARANLATQSETLQLTRWRTEAGLTSSLDVEQARTAVEQTRAQIPALDASLAAARHRLAVLGGRAPGSLDARLAAPGSIPAVPDALPVGIPADTVRQRPDLRAAERRLAAETARVGVAEAARFPSLALGGSVGLESLTFQGLGEGGAFVGRLAVSLAAPLFDAGRRRAQVEAQSAVQERALRTYEAAVLAALEDVENALVQLASARLRRAALLQAAEAARNAAVFAEQRYAAGITDFQTVLDTQRTLLSAQDTLQATEAEQAAALIRLYKALGGGWGAAQEG